MARGGRGPGQDDGTITLQQGHLTDGGRNSSDMGPTATEKNTTAKTGRVDGAATDRIDADPESTQRFGSGYEHEDRTEKTKARGADVFDPDAAEGRSGYSKLSSVNFIAGEDSPPVTKTTDLIEGGE